MIYAHTVVGTFATQFQIIKSIKLLPLNALFYYKFREHSHLLKLKIFLLFKKSNNKQIKTMSPSIKKTKTTLLGLNVAD